MGLAGQEPTASSTPAAKYALQSGFGPQITSGKVNFPRALIGSAPRAAVYKQHISKAHTTVLFGRGSPGPCVHDAQRGNGAVGWQLRSSAGTRPSWGFGTAGRFAQAAPRPASSVGRKGDAAAGGRLSATEAHFVMPGPGAYKVQ